MNANMKAFIERTLPILQPYLVPNGERTSHPLREKHPGVVMLSVAGFPSRASLINCHPGPVLFIGDGPGGRALSVGGGRRIQRKF